MTIRFSRNKRAEYRSILDFSNKYIFLSSAFYCYTYLRKVILQQAMNHGEMIA